MDKPVCKTGAVGDVLFRFKAEGAIRGVPAFDSDNAAYFGDGAGNIYAVDCFGQLKWKWKTGAGVFKGPFAIGTGGTVYAGASGLAGGRMIAFDFMGIPRWNYSSENFFDMGPALLADGTPLTGYSGTMPLLPDTTGGLVMFDSDGSLKAGYPVQLGAVAAPPVVNKGSIFVPTSDSTGTGMVSALWGVAAAGVTTWKTPLTGIPSPAAIGSDGTIYLAENTKDLEQPASVISVDPVTGAKRWSYPLVWSPDYTKGTAGSPLAAATAGGDDVVVMTRDGHLVSLNSKGASASLVFNVELTKSERSGFGSPLLADDGYFYAAVGESLTQVKLFKVSRDGKEVALLSSIDNAKGTTSLAITGGILWFGTEGGELIAVQTAAAGLSNGSAWPSHRHDRENTGNAGFK
jgi:hypothetical protein